MIRIRNLVKDYVVDGVSFGAVNGIDLDIPDGEFFTLLGPSGCGKSTLLRCISGLETPTEGEIEVDGRVVFSSAKRINVAPNKRGMGMVFQSYAIWPHMTVAGNVAFPLEVQKIGDRKAKVERALTLVGLDKFADRMSSRLSGGQQQRVALARAIIADPKTLLLDEPLSNLDAALREQMRHELARIHRALGVTTIFVTHDQDEALSLSQSIAVLDGGKVVEVASPENLYRRPRDLFSARFLGAANVFDGEGVAAPEGRVAIHTGFGTIYASGADAATGGRYRYFVRPEAVRVAPAAAAPRENEFPGTVVSRSYLGHRIDLVVALRDNTQLRCVSDGGSAFSIGDAVAVSIDPADLRAAHDGARAAAHA